ncbi:MAG: DNA topoisomerase IB [Candidatus Eremiobacteraeota bacterium]|nr:DNA topoisomerase IB [Candidatus Eremiobacteraeota bacterium]
MIASADLDSAPQIARAAGLRYISDEVAGIRRKLAGKHFRFMGIDGKAITDRDEIDRIRKLAIPPAYTDVWISPVPNGHIQATGRDARGRKQYRYHKRWREVRDENKFAHTVAFATALPRIRKRVESDLKLPGLPKAKILATIVQLLESTRIRIGNESYAKENHSFGLTTLRNRHVDVNGTKVTFQFRGKSGVAHTINLHNRSLAKIIQACHDIPGQNLFQYIGTDGSAQSIDSADVNDYIREIAGEEFTAKDFRTWVGTVTCAVELGKVCAQGSGDSKKCVADAVVQVAKHLGNTPSVCRACYIHPAIIDDFLENGAITNADEKTVLRALKRRTRETPQKRTARQLAQSLRAEKGPDGKKPRRLRKRVHRGERTRRSTA